MNTFMPYLDTFMNIDALDALEEIVPGNLNEPIPALEENEDNAYRYELEIVVDEDDDFFIG